MFRIGPRNITRNGATQQPAGVKVAQACHAGNPSGERTARQQRTAGPKRQLIASRKAFTAATVFLPHQSGSLKATLSMFILEVIA